MPTKVPRALWIRTPDVVTAGARGDSRRGLHWPCGPPLLPPSDALRRSDHCQLGLTHMVSHIKSHEPSKHTCKRLTCPDVPLVRSDPKSAGFHVPPHPRGGLRHRAGPGLALRGPAGQATACLPEDRIQIGGCHQASELEPARRRPSPGSRPGGHRPHGVPGLGSNPVQTLPRGSPSFRDIVAGKLAKSTGQPGPCDSIQGLSPLHPDSPTVQARDKLPSPPWPDECLRHLCEL